MFLRNAWYCAALAEELTGAAVLARTILDEPVVLFRTAAGRATAFEDRCCHRAAPLSMGYVAPEGLVCGYHGLTFDEGGACVKSPGQEHVPAAARVRVYPVVERHQLWWIWMGDPDAADPAAIPSFPGYTPADDAKPRADHAVLYVKGSYELLLENLMDLTHLAYLHRGSIGAGENGVTFSRLMLDAKAPIKYVAPAVVLQFTGAVDAGKYAQGVRTGGHRIRGIHAFAPESADACFYFFSFLSDYTGNAGERLDAAAIFREDVAMVERQHQRLRARPEGLINVNSDGARVQMTRLLRRKIADEATARSS